MDNKPCDELSELTGQLLPGIEAIYQNSAPLPNSDLIVISPSVDIESDFLKSFHQKGTEIISEIELASRLNSASLIGITGTNGKSTCTSLIDEILVEGGKIRKRVETWEPLSFLLLTKGQQNIECLKYPVFKWKPPTVFILKSPLS